MDPDITVLDLLPLAGLIPAVIIGRLLWMLHRRQLLRREPLAVYLFVLAVGLVQITAAVLTNLAWVMYLTGGVLCAFSIVYGIVIITRMRRDPRLGAPAHRRTR